jgi:peroxiredoxin Q/BCP
MSRALHCLCSLAVAVAFGALAGCAPTARPVAEPSRLEPISAAPDFAAPDETGKLRTLSEFRGRAVVLYFYPKDGTPGCTREACAFRDEWQRLNASGAQVLGVSLDSVESHAAFKAQHKLPFPLLSDTDGRVLRAYGVPKNAKGYASRTTFIIDSQGIIRRIFPEVDPAVHVGQVLRVLEDLRAQGLDASAAPAASNQATTCSVPSEQPMSNATSSMTFLYMITPKRAEMPTSPTPDEEKTMGAHFEYLKGLMDKGVVLLAGPTTEPPHVGIVVFRAADRAAAQAIMDGDPAVHAGVVSAKLSELRLSLFAGQK